MGPYKAYIRLFMLLHKMKILCSLLLRGPEILRGGRWGDLYHGASQLI